MLAFTTGRIEENHVKEAMLKFSPNGSNQLVSFQEFCRFLNRGEISMLRNIRKHFILESRKEESGGIRQELEKYDTQRNGNISRSDFLTVMQSSCMLSSGEANLIFEKFGEVKRKIIMIELFLEHFVPDKERNSLDTKEMPSSDLKEEETFNIVEKKEMTSFNFKEEERYKQENLTHESSIIRDQNKTAIRAKKANSVFNAQKIELERSLRLLGKAMKKIREQDIYIKQMVKRGEKMNMENSKLEENSSALLTKLAKIHNCFNDLGQRRTSNQEERRKRDQKHLVTLLELKSKQKMLLDENNILLEEKKQMILENRELKLLVDTRLDEIKFLSKEQKDFEKRLSGAEDERENALLSVEEIQRENRKKEDAIKCKHQDEIYRKTLRKFHILFSRIIKHQEHQMLGVAFNKISLGFRHGRRRNYAVTKLSLVVRQWTHRIQARAWMKWSRHTLWESLDPHVRQGEIWIDPEEIEILKKQKCRLEKELYRTKKTLEERNDTLLYNKNMAKDWERKFLRVSDELEARNMEIDLLKAELKELISSGLDK
eukprot:g3054.t1